MVARAFMAGALVACAVQLVAACDENPSSLRDGLSRPRGRTAGGAGASTSDDAARSQGSNERPAGGVAGGDDSTEGATPAGTSSRGGTPQAPGDADAGSGAAQDAADAGNGDASTEPPPGPPPPPAPPPPGPPPAPPPAPADPGEGALQRCADLTNAYRATIGRAPLRRASALESYARVAASSDGQSGQPHGYFSQTGGGGISFAENAIPGWPSAQFGGLAGVMGGGLQAMWNEGPGGGHYENMSADRFREIGCGVYVTGNDAIWIVQEFR